MIPVELLEPFLPAPIADQVERLGRDAAPYRVYVEAPTQEGLGAGLVRRHDAVKGHLERILASGAEVDLDDLFARTNLFRGIWAEGDRILVPGCEGLLADERLLEAARRTSGKPIVRPTMLYANVLLPGQELALHTDTPHYRGIDKSAYPEWLMVVMGHSGLFEPWRVSVAAAVAFLGGCDAGGELIVYADGRDAPPTLVEATHDRAVILDADELFHGVARVGGPDAPAPPVTSGTEVHFDEASGRWALREGDETRATYARGELRFSLQWKALCFADETEMQLFDAHLDDLDEVRVRDVLTGDLRRRGRIDSDTPGDTELAITMIDEYVRFPA